VQSLTQAQVVNQAMSYIFGGDDVPCVSVR